MRGKTCLKCHRKVERYGLCSFHDKEGRLLWAENLEGKPCVLCGKHGDLDGHHVIPKQRLRNAGLLPAVWDLRNQAPLCRPCHDAVTVGARRFDYDFMPESFDDFLADYGLEWMREAAS